MNRERVALYKAKVRVVMSHKELRQIARETLAAYLKGKKMDPAKVHAAVQILHAPQMKGE